MESELHQSNPSEFNIRRNLLPDLNDFPLQQNIEQDAINVPEYFQLESIPLAQVSNSINNVEATTSEQADTSVRAGTSAEAMEAGTTTQKKRKNRTGQEQIDYRLEQAEIAAEKAAKKAKMKLAKARALAEKNALAFAEKQRRKRLK